MNDVVRQVAGALGIAIIGSIMNTVYRDRMMDATGGLPDGAIEPARDSVGAALGVATQIGGPAGDALAVAARSGFVDAMGIAALTAAAVALGGALIVARWLPAHHAATPVPHAPARTAILRQSPAYPKTSTDSP
jgi:hypothetical protein